MTPEIATLSNLILEIGLGLLFFALVIPDLTHRPGGLPESDHIPWRWTVSGYFLGIAASILLLQSVSSSPEILFPATLMGIGYGSLAIPLIRRFLGCRVTMADPWWRPIRDVADRAGVGRMPVLIVPSASLTPSVTAFGELLLPSALLRVATPEEVAVLAAPAILSRKRKQMAPSAKLAAGDQLAAEVFSDPDLLRQAFQLQGNSLEADARVAVVLGARQS